VEMLVQTHGDKVQEIVNSRARAFGPLH
jgi:hypothetical protein